MSDSFTPELGQAVFGTPNVAGNHDASWARDGLYLLSEAIGNDMPSYGSDFENDVFEMHPYWWGSEEAPEAERPNFRHKGTGIEISWYKRIGRGMSGPEEPKDWPWLIAECIASLPRPQ
jgi:hypothetical protein